MLVDNKHTRVINKFIKQTVLITKLTQGKNGTKTNGGMEDNRHSLVYPQPVTLVNKDAGTEIEWRVSHHYSLS